MNLTILQDATPDREPLQVGEVYSFLVVTPDTETADMQQLITAARIVAEVESGRELAVKQFLLTLDHFPVSFADTSLGVRQHEERAYAFTLAAGYISLLDPLVSIDSITYTTPDGLAHTMAAGADYIMDATKHPGIVCPAYGCCWPTDNLAPSGGVRITFTAGMTPAQVPALTVTGMKLLISEWYNNRLPFSDTRFVSEVPYGVRASFTHDKLWKF